MELIRQHIVARHPGRPVKEETNFLTGFTEITVYVPNERHRRFHYSIHPSSVDEAISVMGVDSY
jgi:hypothetical protein